MTAETNKIITKTMPAEYLITVQYINDMKTYKIPKLHLYNMLEVFISDDNITGLIIYKTNYKTTMVKID